MRVLRWRRRPAIVWSFLSLDRPSLRKTSVKLYHLLLTVLVFVVADRALALLTPEFYREHSDRERIINEYHTRQFAGALRRAQRIEALVIGDSRARYGVDPAHLSGPFDNVPHNLAIDGAGVTTYAQALPKLLRRFPNVKHVVWGISPRIFNVAWKDHTASRLVSSAGYRAFGDPCPRAGLTCRADEAFALVMSTVSQVYAQRSVLAPLLLDSIAPPVDAAPRFRPLQPLPMSPYGYMRLPDHALQDTDDPELLAKYRRARKRGWFKWNETAYARFEELITRELPESVNLLLFIPPMHATLASLGTADHDATPDTHYKAVVARLRDLASAHEKVRFVDLNNDGANPFEAVHWGNFDHLNAAGAKVLAQQLSHALGHARD